MLSTQTLPKEKPYGKMGWMFIMKISDRRLVMQAALSTSQARKKIKLIMGADIEPDLKFIRKCFDCIQGNPHQPHTPKFWEQAVPDEKIAELARAELPLGYTNGQFLMKN